MKRALNHRIPRDPKAIQRVNVDFPRELLEAIDAEAARLAIPRQAFIKLRLADSLKERRS